MPKLLRARPPQDEAEEQLIRRLAAARTARYDTVLRARMVVLSWDGLGTAAIAAELRCHAKTVREHLSRFNAEGVPSLTERPKVGRKPRLTDRERQVLVTLAQIPMEPADEVDLGTSAGDAPPPDASAERREPWDVVVSRWTLDHLVAVARKHGIVVGRSHLRRILRQAGFRWERGGFWVAPMPPVAGRSVSG